MVLEKRGAFMTGLINRVDYKSKQNMDFEIVSLQRFFNTRSHQMISKDYRLNFWTIIYITEGTGTHYVDFKGYDYKAGDVIFVQKNQVHHYEISDAKGYIINVNEPFFYKVSGLNEDIFLEFLDRAFGLPIMSVSDDGIHDVLLELTNKEYLALEPNIELIAALFQSFIVSIRGALKEGRKILLSKDYENFKVYRQLVEAHYTTLKSVEDYASLMHLSRKTINQATRKVVDLSAKQFIIERIILEIKRYLSQGELLNYEIADILGFDEVANMTNFFKHYVGISPKAFRDNIIS